MTQRDYDADRCTAGERCRGVLELAIIVGIVAWTLTSSSLLMLPVLAAAGGLLAVLAIWDDAACRRAAHKGATARERTASAPDPKDRLQESSRGKRAA
jgi:hypothetical protein